MLKGHGSQLEGQVWDNLNRKIITVIDHILLDKIRLYDPILILIQQIGKGKNHRWVLKLLDARLLSNKIFI